MTDTIREQAPQAPAAGAAAPGGVIRESDHMLMELALLAGSTVTSLPSLGRGLWQTGGRRRAAAVRRFFGEYRPHPALYLAVALAIFGGVNFVQSHTIATGVVVNGEYIGAVENRAVYESARSFVQISASEALGYDYGFEDESLRTRPALVATENLMTQEQLVNQICDANAILTYAYVLQIDGQTVAIDRSLPQIQSVLKAKLNEYRTENTIAVEFCQSVEITKDIVSEEDRGSYAAVGDAINATSQEEVVYTIQTGDTWSQIAARYDMSSSELLALNPEYDIDKIWVNQELTVSAAVPLLSVKTVDHEAYQAPVAYEIEYVDDNTMYQGESKVLTAGVEGLADVEANVTYIDGAETNRDVVSSVTITAPVTQVVAKGTKERPKTMASGTFAWPASGKLTSTFGGRKSPGGIGSTNHKGIDIANSRGTAIKAADGGTVSYAGWMSGYGYLVIIDHGNGYQTYYGHNSKLLVSVGTKVYKGQQIANMGSTGNSTGNHCHFEIRLHGTPVNPLKYLP